MVSKPEQILGVVVNEWKVLGSNLVSPRYFMISNV